MDRRGQVVFVGDRVAGVAGRRSSSPDPATASSGELERVVFGHGQVPLPFVAADFGVGIEAGIGVLLAGVCGWVCKACGPPGGVPVLGGRAPDEPVVVVVPGGTPARAGSDGWPVSVNGLDPVIVSRSTTPGVGAFGSGTSSDQSFDSTASRIESLVKPARSRGEGGGRLDLGDLGPLGLRGLQGGDVGRVVPQLDTLGRDVRHELLQAWRTRSATL